MNINYKILGSVMLHEIKLDMTTVQRIAMSRTLIVICCIIFIVILRDWLAAVDNFIITLSSYNYMFKIVIIFIKQKTSQKVCDFPFN